MNQKKIGDFLKELRKEKGVTQEQLAEILGVSGRSVSRWETGSNMPDLDILILIADYYDVEIREILDGERKDGNMKKEMEETVLKIADYKNHEEHKFMRRMCCLFVLGLLAFTVYGVMNFFGIRETFANGIVAGILSGFAYGVLILGVLLTSGALAKVRAFKMRLLKRSDESNKNAE